MPNKLTIKIDDDTLELEADQPFDEHTVNIVKTWAEALTPQTDDEKALVEKLRSLNMTAKGNTDMLRAAVDRGTTPSSPSTPSIALTDSQPQE